MIKVLEMDVHVVIVGTIEKSLVVFVDWNIIVDLDLFCSHDDLLSHVLTSSISSLSSALRLFHLEVFFLSDVLPIVIS